MEGVGGKLVDRHIIPNEARGSGLLQDVPDRRLHLMLSADDVFVSMQKGGELGVAMSMRSVRDPGVRLDDKTRFFRSADGGQSWPGP